MIVAIHQPEHLPWLGFFHKMALADLFIVLDDVQFRRRYFQNRNKIKGPKGGEWVTVPVKKSDRDSTLIKDIELSNVAVTALSKNLKRIVLRYRSAPFFEEYIDSFSRLYSYTGGSLKDFNLNLIFWLKDCFGFETELVSASQYNVQGAKGDRIFNLCVASGANEYLSGISGKDYLDTELFVEKSIKLSFQKFYHPIYSQIGFGFEPCMSAIDLLFNHGPESLDILMGRKGDQMKDLFY